MYPTLKLFFLVICPVFSYIHHSGIPGLISNAIYLDSNGEGECERIRAKRICIRITHTSGMLQTVNLSNATRLIPGAKVRIFASFFFQCPSRGPAHLATPRLLTCSPCWPALLVFAIRQMRPCFCGVAQQNTVRVNPEYEYFILKHGCIVLRA